MSLSERINSQQPTGTPARHRAPRARCATAAMRQDVAATELRHRIHQQLIDELGPILFDRRLSEEDLRRRVHDQLHAAIALERVPLSAADKARLIQDVSDDILGYGPIDSPAQGGGRHRDHGQRPRAGLRGALAAS